MIVRAGLLLLWLVIGSLPAGCAQGGSPMKTTPEEAPQGRYGNENDDARRALWATCLRRQVERIDDMVSNATTVARAAMELCREHAVSAPADRWGRPLLEYVREDINFATVIVLEKRAESRRSGGSRRP